MDIPDRYNLIYTQSPALLLTQSIPQAQPNTQTPKTLLPPCPVCYKHVQTFKLQDCQHEFCQNCIAYHIALAIYQGQLSHLVCLEHTCQHPLSQQFISKWVSPEKLQRLKILQKRAQIQDCQDLIWCPSPDCQGYAQIQKGNLKLTCIDCFFQYCFKCRKKWHEGGCKKDLEENQFQRWKIGKNVKQCPKCKRTVEKIGGCPSMKCEKCGKNWCWMCGSDINNHDPGYCKFGVFPWNIHGNLIWNMILIPFLLPFLFLIAMMRKRKVYLINWSDQKQSFKFWFFNRQILVFCIGFLFSPAIVILFIQILPFIILEEATGLCFLGQTCIQYLWKGILVVFLGTFLIPVSNLLIITLVVILHLLGLVFGILKLFYIIFTYNQHKTNHYPKYFFDIIDSFLFD